MAGKHTASSAPYGYLKSSEDKNQWLVDPEAAAVVRRIYGLTMEGYGPYQICCILSSDKIEIPGYYLAQRGAGLHQSHMFPDPYRWTSTTVCGILRKREYLGHTVNFKSKKNSYKDKRNRYVPEEEWVVFENTHEAIIDKETFDNVQRIRGNVKRRPDGWGYIHPLTGLLYCADCGGKLYVHRTYNGKNKPQYICGNYSKHISAKNGKISSGTQCPSAHRMDAETLMELIKETLRSITRFAQNDKALFKRAVRESLSERQTDEMNRNGKRLAVSEKRNGELDVLLRKIYEDNTLGKLSDKRFLALSSEYENEQAALEKEIALLQASVAKYESGNERAAQFMELVKRYQLFDEMTVPMLNEFVEKIIVHERDRKGCIDTTQKVDIHFNFIGAFNAPQEEADPAMIAMQEEERRRKLARQERLHENYLKRKASGKQQAYDRMYNEKRRVKREVVKAAGHRDGIAM